jgi:hypothetical protein
MAQTCRKIKIYSIMLASIVCTRFFSLIEALDRSTFGRGLVTSTDDMAERASRDRQQPQGSYANFGGRKFYRKRSESVSRAYYCLHVEGLPNIAAINARNFSHSFLKICHREDASSRKAIESIFEADCRQG